VREVCGKLFDYEAPTYEIERRFTDECRGQHIEWSGSLFGVTVYLFDRVFGDERGVKATFEIFESKARLGSRSVLAVVQFPIGKQGGLEPLVGKSLIFMGVLFACDASMRTLFVSDGSLSRAHQ
jgi:hypothetical protein